MGPKTPTPRAYRCPTAASNASCGAENARWICPQYFREGCGACSSNSNDPLWSATRWAPPSAPAQNRPLLVRFLLGNQANDFMVKAGRGKNILHDQDDLGQSCTKWRIHQVTQ